MTGHSPLGASGAERWLACPGSVALIKQLALPETDEPEYRGLGIAAHDLAADCLSHGFDTWERIGEQYHGFTVDKEMADAVQVYLDAVRPPQDWAGVTFSDFKFYTEYRISSPDHKDFYGTLDSALRFGTTVEINDYKHGQGIAVDVEDNPQLMYYAYGFLREHPEITTVILRIIQPRISYRDAVQDWETTAEYINKWANEVLLPGMRLAELENGDLDAGEHCRFCPAKLLCPLMNNLFGAAATTNPQEIKPITNESLGRSYNLVQAVEHYIKALEEEVYARLNRAETVPGTKLVMKKSNRVFKLGAPIKESFGDDALNPAELKSPAELDKLGLKGKEFTKEWAYSPSSGLTVATEDDKRIAVKVQTTHEAFSKAISNL